MNNEAYTTKTYLTRDQFEAWSELTWQQMWDTAKNRSIFLKEVNEEKLKAYLQKLRRVNDFDNFSSQRVTGGISQGWQDLNIKGPLFQESLWTVMQMFPTNWTPVEYLLEYCLECKRSEDYSIRYDLGRAVRNLPSFLREYVIHADLISRDLTVRIPSPAENSAGHADIYVIVNGIEIAIWSFQKTAKSIQMLNRKLKLRAAYFAPFNLLAPFDTERDSQTLHDWHLPSISYIDDLVSKINAMQPDGNDLLREMLDGRLLEDERRFLLATSADLLNLREN